MEDNKMRVLTASSALRAEPNCTSGLETEVLFGHSFIVESIRNGWAFGATTLDGYRGYLKCTTLGDPEPQTTHRVCIPKTIAYKEPHFKAKPTMRLPFNAYANVVAKENGYAHVAGAGWVHEPHLAPIGVYAEDWVREAERFLGAPYLYGGCTMDGIDCSAVVQQGRLSVGAIVKRNTGDQVHTIGHAMVPDETLSNLKRGDLVFWSGHVGIMTGPKTLIHATGDFMAVVEEGIWTVVERRQKKDGGQIVAVRRL